MFRIWGDLCVWVLAAFLVSAEKCHWNPLHDLIINSQIYQISLEISYENLLIDQDNNFYPISPSSLITCLLDNLWILLGEVTY